MFRPSVVLAVLALLALDLAAARAQEAKADAHATYLSRCAACHGSDRLGGIGPALLPENLGRLRKTEAARVIAEGRPATQMPGFAEDLDARAIDALVAHVYAPLPALPRWGMAEIEASRVALPAVTAERPVHSADPLNLFVVVEGGDHHVTILDGDRFEPIARVPSRFALHGGPKFTSDGRYVFWASRDGWVTKFDLWALAPVAEIRAGINTRNIAVSGDGKVVAVANYLPHSLVLLDASDLSPIKVIDVKDANGKQTSRVSAVYQAPTRKSFIAALKDVPEIWEIFYDENPPKVYSGFVHSYEKGLEEGLAQKERFPVRRIATDEPLDDFFFDPSYRNLIGSSRDGGKGVVVNLVVGRPIATIDLPGLPHLGSGITWRRDGTTIVATPNLKEGVLTFIDTKDWRILGRLATPGPGFFLRSHQASRFAWGDAMMSPARDTMYVLDKTSLDIVRTIRPAPGKTAAHVEFDRTGRHALVSVWELDGALVVYDAETLEEVKRLPMSKPVGKYNVFNKITFSEGTSH